MNLKALFDIDKCSPVANNISEGLLSDIDVNILSFAENITVSPEILHVYEKFVPMKQDAPESMKNNLFTTIRNFAQEQVSSKNYLNGLILYRFLIVKSDLIAGDYYSIAEAFFVLKNPDLALKFIDLYKDKEANKPLLFLTLANFYNLEVSDYKSAIKYYEKYLGIDKTKPVIYKILANLYSKEFGDSSLNDQIKCYLNAYNINPTDRTVLHGLAFCYEKIGNKESAKRYYKELLENNPTDIDYFNYGAFLISCGELREGHKYFRYRFKIDNENYKYPDLPKEKFWNLESDISDKILLVHYEQGFGDTLMYCRFIPQLKQFARKIIFVVQDNLFELIKNSPKIIDGVELISDKTDINSIKYDYHMALLDAPYVLKCDIQDIPFCKEGYIEINKNVVNTYAKNYIKPSKNLKIGIAYSGDSNANYIGRDIDLNKFNRLTDISGVDLYLLQYGADSCNSKITALGKTFKNFTDTASAIKNMDIVITTDNVILNLAGALGVKTIALFNKETNYRWFKLSGDNVGWYESVKPLQVKVQNAWTPVFSQVVNIIVKEVSIK